MKTQLSASPRTTWQS